MPNSAPANKTEKLVKYKWDEEKRESFMETMQSDEIKQKLQEATSFIDTDIDQALSIFNECFMLAGKCMKVTYAVGAEKLKVWFDLECKESRRALRNHLRMFHGSHCDEDREMYAEKRRQYKDLLKKKKT